MKILNLKKLKLLYVNLIAIAFLLPSLDGVVGGLYAQDPELFNHTWYLENIVIDSESYFLNDYADFESTIIFNEPNDEVVVFICGFDSFQSDTVYIGNNSFEIFNIELNPFFGSFGECDLYGGYMEFYKDAFFSIYLENYDTPNNPFFYSIQSMVGYYQLTIENDKGDEAVYNSVLMSSPDFNANNFALFPNPVNETLYVNNGSNQAVTATVYDLNGKLLQTHSLEAGDGTIDVKTLSPGLYFVVFESEDGERVSRKFVKK